MNRLANVRKRAAIFLALLIPLILATACVPVGGTAGPAVNVSVQAHEVSPHPCENRFVAHTLDHITTIAGEVIRTYDSNGAGLAVNDLDRDGDLDLVLANLAGPNAILWNQGDFEFLKQAFPHGQSRGVSIVDIDGDGWLDIAFAHRVTRPLVWMNDGHSLGAGGAAGESSERVVKRIPGFTRVDWFAAPQKAYTLSWADLDGDIDLDFVLATYQTEYTRVDPHDLANGGVVYYENTGEDFVPTHLATYSQALALLLIDLNQDGRLDIWAGHDFLMPDQVWLWSPQGWMETETFTETAQNTMSFAVADIDNDGRDELFSADMKPYPETPEVMAAWSPLMEMMADADIAGDQQIIENVLQVPSAAGGYNNEAASRGLEASGWSWSAQFGDLDQDGFVDLYVVNGMAAEEMFGHLPGAELVEENLAYRNDGKGYFQPVPSWGLNTTEGGRSMAMADLDNDGDLDVVVNNLLAPSMIYENRLCGGNSLTVDLAWPGSMNTRAIGAHLKLHTTAGNQVRTLRSNSGYLTGEPAQAHFGFPAGSTPLLLEIRWPDGAGSNLVVPFATGGRLFVERTD
ncbi:MAG: CRTAC1 family protein [Caldilineaceae bacterium SB0661_bin_32]|uniref:CRTAC1 family protein n=1 Tax=Caldilineaceae bacterium SB0661_bin_32 TaxID=2605255 RepID=A0A6B1D2P2_9CHLR|nr:CRTAC1 family protein [Caldilineaceae bacterium SB0661_bin_32]